MTIIRPKTSRWDKCLGFASELPSSPLSQRHLPGAPEASHAGHAPSQTVGQLWFRHQLFKSSFCTGRKGAFHRRKSLHLPPEENRIPEFTNHELTKPLMTLREDERLTFFIQLFQISGRDRVICLLVLDRQVLGVGRELGSQESAEEEADTDEAGDFKVNVALFVVCPGSGEPNG